MTAKLNTFLFDTLKDWPEHRLRYDHTDRVNPNRIYFRYFKSEQAISEDRYDIVMIDKSPKQSAVYLKKCVWNQADGGVACNSRNFNPKNGDLIPAKDHTTILTVSRDEMERMRRPPFHITLYLDARNSKHMDFKRKIDHRSSTRCSLSKNEVCVNIFLDAVSSKRVVMSRAVKSHIVEYPDLLMRYIHQTQLLRTALSAFEAYEELPRPSKRQRRENFMGFYL